MTSDVYTDITQTALNQTHQASWLGHLEPDQVWIWIDQFLLMVRTIVSVALASACIPLLIFLVFFSETMSRSSWILMNHWDCHLFLYPHDMGIIIHAGSFDMQLL